MTAPAATIIEALDDPALLGAAFQGDSWSTWRAILKAAYCLPMTAEEIELFRAVAERDPPTRQVRELVIIAGRRGGKDSIASAIAAHAGAFRDYHTFLRPGERAVIACLAVDRDQAGIVLGYTKSYFAEGPLAALVESDVSDGLDLSTGASIQINTNSFRRVRGRTIALAIFDELAFWLDDASASPDKETYRAILPGMSTVPGAMLVMISSPYRKSGLLYEKYRKHYGKPGDVLVIKAPSKLLNPTLDQSIIDEALEEDPSAAAAEWLGEFRNDIEAFVSREVIDAAITPGRHELPPVSTITYVGYTDPSGGSSDSMTLAIAHRDQDGRSVLDAIRERRPPFSPDDVVQEFTGLLKAYRVREVHGDRYGGEWPRERFKAAGVEYVLSDRPASDFYRDVLPLLNSGRAELLDHPRMAAQFANLERRTSRSGKDTISHPPQGHDDIANSVAGVLVLAAAKKSFVVTPRLLELSSQRGPARRQIAPAQLNASSWR